ncbi:hypothetical protein SAMN05421874_1101 [Nonomuraea maritima]|uniref:Phage integrase family protein n=1 Tax=Nonomuraea maritima TaxID=683260 RepID=A0A1G9DU66_9ACTN|nr:hypothetical protein [Nonomuraea maritima]SDK67417.1 hypothetical protein SAMN05421874_1101 [Nonomuraea maritima]
MDRLWVSVLQRVFDVIDEKNEAIRKAKQSDDPEVRASARGKRITGPATKQRIRATLSTVLSDAVRQQVISVNNAGAIKLESAKRPKALVWTKQRVEAYEAKFAERLAVVRAEAGGKKVSAVRVWESAELRPSPVMVWTPVQLGAFLDVAAQHRLYALFHLIAFRGLRRGEGCGARWVDLDVDERTLAVEKQLVQIGWEFEEGAPKTEASDGVIALDTGTVAVLKEHRVRQTEDAWRGARGGRTPAASSLTRTAPSCTRRGSANCSLNSRSRRACRRSGCTTYGTVPPLWRTPPARTRRWSARCCGTARPT